MKLGFCVAIGYIFAFVIPWIVGTSLGYNPTFSGLAFLIVLGIAVIGTAFLVGSGGKKD